MRVLAMDRVRYECDCDRVIEMQEMEIGIKEILQYSHAVFTREEVQSLIRGLEEQIEKASEE